MFFVTGLYQLQIILQRQLGMRSLRLILEQHRKIDTHICAREAWSISSKTIQPLKVPYYRGLAQMEIFANTLGSVLRTYFFSNMKHYLGRIGACVDLIAERPTTLVK